MPAKLKEVRTRISSVNSTQQITKAMKMVSASKLRKAQDAILHLRPYAQKLASLLSDIAAGAPSDHELKLAETRGAKNVIILAISSDKGLCGGYNSTIIKMTNALLSTQYAEQQKAGRVKVLPIGKRAHDFFRKRNMPIVDDFWNILGKLTYADARRVADYLVKQFVARKVDRVDVIFSQFKNAATQIFQVDNYLPVRPPTKTELKDRKADFVFEPDQQDLMEVLVPKILRTQMYRYLLDATASEHGARMTAMDKASENANELLKDLRLTYNRARQAAITTELIEIVSGANALEG
jgi:F-type H+-transporting ATPase subunit gamma